MYKTQAFTYGGYQAEILAFRGNVAETQQNRTVHTHVSGGGGIINNNVPSIVSPISSSTTEHVYDRFFLVDEAANQETEISLTDWNFPARVGHDVAFCWLIPKGKKSGPFVYGINYTLNQEKFKKEKLPRFNLLHRMPFKVFRLLTALFIGCCVSYIHSYDQYGYPNSTTEKILSFVIGVIAGWFIVRWIVKMCFARAINNGIRAEQQMRSNIYTLCQQALKTEEK